MIIYELTFPLNPKSFRELSTEVFETNCPWVERKIRVKDQSVNWYNSEIGLAKRELRKAEKKYLQQRTSENLTSFRRLRQIKCQKVTSAKKVYYKRKIQECGNNSKKMYNNELNKLLGRGRGETNNILPMHDSPIQLANDFKDYFIEKIDSISALS